MGFRRKIFAASATAAQQATTSISGSTSIKRPRLSRKSEWSSTKRSLIFSNCFDKSPLLILVHDLHEIQGKAASVGAGFVAEVTLKRPYESPREVQAKARIFRAGLKRFEQEFRMRDANSAPARFAFIRSKEAKERLRPALAPANIEKTMTAPVTVIVSYDMKFYDQLPKLFPHKPAVTQLFANNPQLVEVTAQRNSSLQGA
jgi:hypothetical protein